MHIRAAVEGIIRKQFESCEIIDEIFDRFTKNVAQFSLMDTLQERNYAISCSEAQIMK